jgi:3-hydroxyacyl-CoA dehydrogenase
MPPLATVDLVGLDVHKAIVDNVYENTKDEAHANFALPTYVQQLIDKGHLGNKTGAKGGFYRRVKENGKNLRYVLDPKSGEYLPPDRAVVEPVPFIEEISKLHRVGRYREAMKLFVEAKGKEADLARKVIFGYVSYALNRVGEGEVVREPRDVDRIMGFGFNWAPPTVLADVIGRAETIAQIEKYGLQVPQVLAGASGDGPLFREPNVNIGRFFSA